MKYIICFVLFIMVPQLKAQDWTTSLPYKHGSIQVPGEDEILSTVFIPSKNGSYIITDSIVVDFHLNGKMCFYFLTPNEEEINLSCPWQYGLIVLAENGTEVYKSFWGMDSQAELVGNCLPSLRQFKTTNGYRNFLSLGSSGCGSGASIQCYDILFTNNQIDFKRVFSYTTGYEDCYFIPKEGIYLMLERIDPECQYGCESKYKISTYLLSSDKLLKSQVTNFKYEDFNDVGVDEIINVIRNKEPKVFFQLVGGK